MSPWSVCMMPVLARQFLSSWVVSKKAINMYIGLILAYIGQKSNGQNNEKTAVRLFEKMRGAEGRSNPSVWGWLVAGADAVGCDEHDQYPASYHRPHEDVAESCEFVDDAVCGTLFGFGHDKPPNGHRTSQCRKSCLHKYGIFCCFCQYFRKKINGWGELI